ncbi:hypothetical protein [uncultured Candidatus Kuenenia sp.]|uniref:hypothetical protein n=1 Tax=uncultured Candidatus Kuenenia sp. TaxID=1048336 RepID=UPI0025D777D2|nr:hypothetical protein [uncultured Candidatus Kuenenia sp.]
MIINIYTIIMLFIAAVSLSLGGVLLFTTLRAILAFDALVPLESKTKYEQKGYLIFLIACVVIGIRMLAWPWFYFMLQSFVPEVPGAMCIFGVTQILPATAAFLQIIKPISFFIMGGWIFCYYADKAHPTSPFTRKILLFLIPICVILFVDSGADVYYLLSMKPLISVSCCATFFDVPLRPSAMIPQAIFGENFDKALFLLYYSINIILIILLFLSLSKRWRHLIPVSDKTLLYLQSGTGLLNIPVTLLSFIEIIAPKLMQLPFHHCLYCFIGNGIVPDASIMLGLFIIGIFGIGWINILRILGKNSSSKQIIELFTARINSLSLFCLLTSLLMVTIHLVLT